MPPAGAVAGPHHPLDELPLLVPGAARRTSNIDTTRPTADDPVRSIEARARDVVVGLGRGDDGPVDVRTDGRLDHPPATDQRGNVDAAGLRVVDAVGLWARVDPATYELLAVGSDPLEPRLDALVGASVGQGFRRRLAQVLDRPADRSSLVNLLLDDLTGAQLVAGYDLVHRDSTDSDPDRTPHQVDPLQITSRFDFCAGWANDGSMVEAIHATGRIPVPMGPPVPPVERIQSIEPVQPSEPVQPVEPIEPIERDTPFEPVESVQPIEPIEAIQRVTPVEPIDPAGRARGLARPCAADAGWHAMAPLAEGAMRRRRRLDVQPAVDGRHAFESHFRDSHVSDAGEETVVHEYLVHGVVDAASRTIVAVESEARVLPWRECPSALASTGQVVGWSLDELRRRVHRELTGVGSCTHLNDTLRSLADLDALVDLVSDPTRTA
jgi:hypothetical protein